MIGLGLPSDKGTTEKETHEKRCTQRAECNASVAANDDKGGSDDNHNCQKHVSSLQSHDKVDSIAVVPPSQSQAVLRWQLIRHTLLPPSKNFGNDIERNLSRVSRRPTGSFNLLPKRLLRASERHAHLKHEIFQRAGSEARSECNVGIEYFLPSSLCSANVSLIVAQRCSGSLQLRDLEACQKFYIDSTGISCLWPAEEVLAYCCVRQPEIFKDKRIVELGSGYGLGGLAVAACTEAAEVVITDGNPLVMEYVKCSISANTSTFGNTRVSEMLLYWGRDSTPLGGRTFDVVVAADCSFFKEFHDDLACTIRSLLHSKESSALLFNPRRGTTLELFVKAAQRAGLAAEVTEQYDSKVWSAHHQLLEQGDRLGWPNYDTDHCYPLLVSMKIA